MVELELNVAIEAAEGFPVASERGRDEIQGDGPSSTQKADLKGLREPSCYSIYMFIYVEALRIILGTSEHLINGS